MTDNTKDEVTLADREYRKTATIRASQWHKNGDHPLDYAKAVDGLENGELRSWTGDEAKALGWEGQVVRYYRNPDDSGERECEKCAFRIHEHGWIDTLEGGHIVCPGDWIATGVKGEHWPIKPDVFEATYEPADRLTSQPAQSDLVEAAAEAMKAWSSLEPDIRGRVGVHEGSEPVQYFEGENAAEEAFAEVKRRNARAAFSALSTPTDPQPDRESVLRALDELDGSDFEAVREHSATLRAAFLTHPTTDTQSDAVREERERCALLADKEAEAHRKLIPLVSSERHRRLAEVSANAATSIAAAIRNEAADTGANARSIVGEGE